ncbi:glyoxalase [Nocardia cyriacigeorgica]|uniref:Glyoxalase n=1 Tax=Nocardia cyriacigeorgica TaxID=135487 RepID=A0A6P1DAY9_9NOCA|nr:VOC family protein [Nocardia cyriacigeorgica]NEW37365.1 glyoxalase [Nocardia cyriacigeorgica]NEW47915.1 glyoxalase [Nocardia cyriacigeorgica]NEW50564.1 glyoxalase [Nocardia cyriacigeorgica]NEW57716.1 glyoxalase [Nocardia cyriacigeorgica]
MGDVAVPVLPTADLPRTLDFYRVLGYQVTYEQTRPYVYGAIEAHNCAIHFNAPQGKGSIPEGWSGCLVMVDDIAERHRVFTTLLRAHYGKIPTKGEPRITRFRPGQSRFSVIDPDGNWVTYIQNDEPMELEYGGSKTLTGLARVLDNARILRDFKNDDEAATRVLEVGLRRYASTASATEVARAWATLTDLAVAMNHAERVAHYRSAMHAVQLTVEERNSLVTDANVSPALIEWLNPPEA